MPFTANATCRRCRRGSLTYTANMVALTGTIIAEVARGTTTMNLFVQTPTGVGTVVDGNLTSNAYIFGSGSYFF